MVTDDELDWSAPAPAVTPKAGAPKADAPKANEPKADEPKADEPKADEPKADEPKADEPKADEPKADEPKADEPKADEPKADASDNEEVRNTPEPAPRLPITARLYGQTDVGQIREHNEDNFLIADLSKGLRDVEATDTQEWNVGDGGLLLAVCDGMGGAAAGEVASQMATDIVFDRMRKAAGHGERDRLALDIVKSLEDAGSSILAEAMSNRACRGMGTTATVAALVDDHLLLGQVGDSRAYILRGSRFVQVTRDQSLVNQLIEAGQLTEEEAENFEHSNIILQALGTADSVQVDLTYVKLYRGDLLMMCSDGLSGMVRDSELRELLGRITDPAEICRVLIEEANLAGGHDNISVIAVRFEGDGLEECNEAATGALKYLKYPLPNATDEDAKHSARSRSLTYDETPSIEVHGEFEVDGDMDWEQLLHDRRMMPNEGAEEGSRTWLWVLAVAAVVLFYVYFLR